MTLIKSISGVRGTIGGKAGENFTPLDILQNVLFFVSTIMKVSDKKDIQIAIGRDGRVSGEIILNNIISTLQLCGCRVYNLDLTTTPTISFYTLDKKLDGAIMISASHNPKEWNALKMMNHLGEFFTENEIKDISSFDEKQIEFPYVEKLGVKTEEKDALQNHIDAILKLPYVDVEKIKQKKYSVVLDAVNSTGSIAMPALLKTMGIDKIDIIAGEMHGDFEHNPEPLEKNLSALIDRVKKTGADIGIAVDPDVDRLVLVSEDGSMFGEEYTLVAASEQILKHKKSALISNMSSSYALRDLAKKYDTEYYSTKVGEANVVEVMKEKNATIGGEGNGGVILKDLHYGRDALVGLALVLTLLSNENKKMSELKNTYSKYEMIKDKMEIGNGDWKSIVEEIKKLHLSAEVDQRDGVKFLYPEGWVHLRSSNTEPIVRIIAEHNNVCQAEKWISQIKDLLK